MSVLAIQLPPRERLASRAAGADAGASLRLPSEWGFVLSNDGSTVVHSGQSAAALLPKADHVLLVLAEGDVSWHRVDIPRAAPARMRAALLGLMEEALLDDDAALHFALGPGAVPGAPGWVAVTHRPWLASALAALEGAGLSIERVVPGSVPAEDGAPARGHFFTTGTDSGAAPLLALASAAGAVCMRLSGALARALQPADADGAATRWTATPAAAVAAERWLGAPVALLADGERSLEATVGKVNLRQFDLAARHRGSRALRDVGQRLLSAEWRPVRMGVAALLLVQLVGVNAYAWQQRQAIAARRLAMTDLLKATHPGVRAVLDAPVQMVRESERLRTAAGKPGDSDLEVLLAAAAAAWPDGLGPAQTLRFETGRLMLAAPGWAEPQIAQFRARLRAAGFTAELAEGRITVARASARPAAGARAAGST